MSDVEAKLYRGKWYAVWYENGRTLRRSLRTNDRHEAERKVVDFRKDLRARPNQFVGDLVASYLAEKEGRVADHRRLRIAWDRAKATFGHLRPDQITATLCREYTSARTADGMSPATIIKEINVVRQALNFHGAKAGASFETPRKPPPRDRHLTRDEFQRLLDGCVSPHVRLFCILALVTAGRKTAILELTWDRVDFRRGLIHLERPGSFPAKGRAIVPMTDRAREALTEAYKGRLTDHVIETNGAPLKDIKKGFTASALRAGLNDVTPHDLRHTAAVWMAESGVSMPEIAQYLGHTDPSITFRVYARFSPDYLRKAAGALNF